MKIIFLLIITLLCFMNIYPKIHTENIDYKDGDVQLQGYLAYDDSKQDKRPGILVFHEWWGLNQYPKDRAEQLAKLGYVAFAVDMYGKGVVAKTADEAGKLAGGVRQNPDLMIKRAKAGLDILKKNKFVDTDKLAAIGFCFGGSVALALAQDGADLKGTAVFHAGFGPEASVDAAKNIKGKVLILHGAADKASPMQNVMAFTDALEKANIDWQLDVYSQAVHAFSNPAAGNDPSKGVAYNENAAKRSWQTMQNFFKEIFK